ncbi:MAG: diguanylate cyclase response regulator [Gammaproteobacteria bacterium]|nr:diguanylate cyclase response regulator [Gammaproteobacteria bacterium]
MMLPDLFNARVLLAEDSDEDALLFRKYCQQLPHLNWTVDRAADFNSCCAAMLERKHDLYFFDYDLGPHNCIDLIHEYHKLGYSAPIIVVTGHDDDRIGEATLLAGATDFLSKHGLTPAVIQRTAHYANIRRNAEALLHKRANEDALTGAFSRDHFIALAQVELSRARHFSQPLSLIMLDIDHFKAVNDEQGHVRGDQIIRMVVARCQNALRGVDLLGRYGGDEFMILLPQTDLAGAAVLAERVRLAVAAAPSGEDPESAVTVSMGVASVLPRTGSDIASLIESADDALYRAKQRGRNRVELAQLTVLVP